VLLAVVVVSVAGLLAAGWLVWRTQRAADALTTTQAELADTRAALEAADLPAARQHLANAQTSAARADAVTHDPLFTVAGALPWLGQTPKAVSTVAATVHDLTDGAVAQLVDAAALLDPRTLRTSGNSVNVSAFVTAAPKLQQAEAGLHAAQQQVAGLDVSATPSQVKDAVTSLEQQLDDAAAATASAVTATQLVPPMLGADGPRRYFLALQSNNESRGTGGFFGAFGIVRVDNGTVSIERLAPSSALNGYTFDKNPVNLGKAYQALYGNEAASWTSANLSPNFPYAARLWQQMYLDVKGEKVDGVIALDPVVLQYLLAVTGPVVLPDGREISADNVVAFSENEIYGVITGDTVRDEYLQSIAKAAFRKVLSGAGSPQGLFDALDQAAAERRLLVWSGAPAEEQLLASTSVGGVIPIGPQPFAGLAVINASGNKMDYYLQQSLDYTVVSCSADGTRNTRITVSLTNEVSPTAKLPYYVDARSDLPRNAQGLTRRGHGVYVDDAQVYGTQGAVLTGAELDGRPVGVATGTERGKSVFRVRVVLRPGKTTTLTLDLREPALAPDVDPEPVTFVSPLVKPVSVTADTRVCPPVS
jgi:hypothetical protein